MPIFRTMLIMPSFTAMPEDVFINTYHTSDLSGAGPSIASSMAVAFDTMFNTPATDGLHPLGYYMSGAIGNTAQIKVYDLSTPEPRVPSLATVDITTGWTATANLPNEIAACVTYHAGPPITQRRRGRIYIGPLNANVLGTTSMGADAPTESRLTLQFRVDLAATFKRFLASTIGSTWVVYSAGARDNSDDDIPYLDRPLLPPVSADVVGGWVDNAFDVQRRRGTDPTVRTVFP